MGLDNPKRTTPLYIDMEISAELLHRSHSEFLSLSSLERKKLRLYWRVKYQKEEKSIRDHKMNQSITG